MAGDLVPFLVSLLRDVVRFCEAASGIKLRSYQQAAAQAIVDSVVRRKGLTFVVIFPRQSGKNELQAQIEAYLLLLFSMAEAEMVKVSPTWKPQSQNAMRRLERVLKKNLLTRLQWKKEQGYLYSLGMARIYFLSGAPTSNIVGATASTLLECDEAQDVLVEKWDKEINPMAASTNATRVFWGTAWSSQTLLAREKHAALEAEKADGVRRLFQVTADEVAKEAPAYGKFVAAEIQKLGREHPFVRSQYYCEEINQEGGMFPAARVALMQGEHPCLDGPQAGEIYAFLMDVGGEDESSGEAANARRHDATALTIVRIDLELLGELSAPRYRVVHRRLWTGTRHAALFGQIMALYALWQPRKILCDATGVGAGLASFLENRLNPGREKGGGIVVPFIFSEKSKSDLGWDFLAVVETGRFLDHRPPSPGADGSQAALQALFRLQMRHCQMEILPGPGRRLRWGVPDALRAPSSGELVHDDLLISAALCAVLDEMPWGIAESAVVTAADPLHGLREIY